MDRASLQALHKWGRLKNSSLLRVEMFGQSLPALVVMRLQLRGFQGEAGWLDQRARFEHERHRVAYFHGYRCIRVRCLLEGPRVRSMSRHAVMQARSSGHEPLGFRVVHAMHEAHEFTRDVPMKPGRPERIFVCEPAR